jgi:hypothetical protein
MLCQVPALYTEGSFLFLSNSAPSNLLFKATFSHLDMLYDQLSAGMPVVGFYHHKQVSGRLLSVSPGLPCIVLFGEDQKQ